MSAPKEKPKKKQPERKCVGCNERRTKQELIRVLRTPEGEILVDRTGKRSGRGAYLCRSPQCLTKAELKVVDGEVVAEFTPEARARSRWSPAGQELHENGIRWGHGRAAKGRETIKEGFASYGVNEYVVELPEIIKE